MSGELALSGQLRPIKGVLSIALEAKRRQRQTLIVPLDNAAEAAVVEGVDVYGASSLSQVVHFCAEISPWSRSAPSAVGPMPDPLNRILISARSKVSSMSNALSKSPPPAGTTFDAVATRRGRSSIDATQTELGSGGSDKLLL